MEHGSSATATPPAPPSTIGAPPSHGGAARSDPGMMLRSQQHRHRLLSHEMRMLAEKETAARNENVDRLREEIARAARTKQILMQNTMERRRRRSERKLSRSGIVIDPPVEIVAAATAACADTSMASDSSGSICMDAVSVIWEHPADEEGEKSATALDDAQATCAEANAESHKSMEKMEKEKDESSAAPTAATDDILPDTATTTSSQSSHASKPSLVDETILVISEFLAELDASDTANNDDAAPAATSSSPAAAAPVNLSMTWADSSIEADLHADPSGISIELAFDSNVEMDTLLDSYFSEQDDDQHDHAPLANGGHGDEEGGEEHVGSILNLIMSETEDAAGDTSVDSILDVSVAHTEILARKHSDAIRMRNELQMLAEVEEQLRQSEKVTEQLLATARKSSLPILETPREVTCEPVSLDDSVLSFPSFYDADLIGDVSSDVVGDRRKSAGRESATASAGRHIRLSRCNTRKSIVDRVLLHDMHRLRCISPVTAFKSELHQLVNGVFASSSQSTASCPSDGLAVQADSGERRTSTTSSVDSDSTPLASLLKDKSTAVQSTHAPSASTSANIYQHYMHARGNDHAAPPQSLPTMITVSPALPASGEEEPATTLMFIRPDAKLPASLSIECPVPPSPAESGSIDKAPSSPRKDAAAASRAEARRQRRKSGVAGTPSGRRSARNSRSAKSASGSNGNTTTQQPDATSSEAGEDHLVTPVAEEFRQILGQHLSDVLAEEPDGATTLHGSSPTLAESRLSSPQNAIVSSTSDPSIRIVAVQGRKARIIFNEKPAPPPGQRPLISQTRTSPLSQEPAARQQFTFPRSDGTKSGQSKQAIPPRLFKRSANLAGTSRRGVEREHIDQPIRHTCRYGFRQYWS
ncbi:hypothetical protein SYNPS1DRAFT_28494 [Syncephalis pseudoplumigaleata]|uniref:Uncharacterized protein n=1 Tax=Syncephalis pseudoplumigaleata TaxID=1712513 RepID=A0A4P9Z058_9FUNG|nr:hypothetical protein SYNPS1DRAFT_28494 [Syncephalis pseudoplumigaleata]|eukprot:RKP25786.1 hypothetical protein SYNPS1DRAFT_28494 [Syncephalis pseudoplumigaleata]